MLRMLDEQRLYILTDNLLGERNSVRLHLTIPLLFSLPCADSIVTAQVAPKPIPKCNEVIGRDKSHPVWKAIDVGNMPD
jgi:hypothetical protein